jgi:hypothetical protein
VSGVKGGVIMDKTEVEKFRKIYSQITDMYTELGILSKKSPDGRINKFKLKFVNQLIDASNMLLGTSLKPFDDFELFDVDDMPSNSDVVLVLSQYIKCLEKLRDNFDMGDWL